MKLGAPMPYKYQTIYNELVSAIRCGTYNAGDLLLVTDANNHSVPQYRAVLWRKQGSQKLCIPYNPGAPLTVKKILR